MNDGSGRELYNSDRRFCPNCGKAIKQGGKFCPACGAAIGESRMTHAAASNMPVRRAETGRQRPVEQAKTENQVGIMKKILVLLLAVLVCVVVYKKFFVNQQEKLIGTWEAASSQILEIETERLTFNYRVFDYSVEGDVLILEEVFPGNSISGKGTWFQEFSMDEAEPWSWTEGIRMRKGDEEYALSELRKEDQRGNSVLPQLRRTCSEYAGNRAKMGRRI